MAELRVGTRFRVIRALGPGELLHGASGCAARLAGLTPGREYLGEHQFGAAGVNQ